MKDFRCSIPPDADASGVILIGVVSNCVECMLAVEDGREKLAWNRVADAQYHYGFFAGVLTANKNVISAAARRAANVLHIEDRAIANDIMEWYRENHSKFTSMDAAAEAATKIAPVKFRTARKHIGEAKKSLSARKE